MQQCATENGQISSPSTVTFGYDLVVGDLHQAARRPGSSVHMPWRLLALELLDQAQRAATLARCMGSEWHLRSQDRGGVLVSGEFAGQPHIIEVRELGRRIVERARDLIVRSGCRHISDMIQTFWQWHVVALSHKL